MHIERQLLKHKQIVICTIPLQLRSDDEKEIEKVISIINAADEEDNVQEAAPEAGQETKKGEHIGR